MYRFKLVSEEHALIVVHGTSDVDAAQQPTEDNWNLVGLVVRRSYK